jgi:HAD superfamily hydrolase (TIGR01509 family)
MYLDGITHVIFDLDGLLIDSEPLWKIAEQAALGRHGKAWDAVVAQQHVGVRVDEVAQIMVRAYGLDVAPAAFADEILADVIALLEADTPVMPGAQAAIQTFYDQGYPLAIASSSPEDYIRAVVQRQGWGDYIGIIASGFHVPRGKPAPDVYLHAANLLGATPSACLALEDSLNGAKAAHAAQMRTVAIPGHGFEAAHFEGVADATFPNLDAMLTAFFGGIPPRPALADIPTR